MDKISFKIYNSVKDLPALWDTVAQSNIFLQTPYLTVLEESAPVNMECFYIGIFENSELIGVSLAQYLDLNKLESFGERDKCFKTIIRNFIFKNFASHTLFLGNNMITGQNGYVFSKEIDFNHISEILLQSADEITLYFMKKGISIHLVSFKDFYDHCSVELKKYRFSNIYEFNTQPNMIFYLDQNWKSLDDYVAALSKKYRDQFKRARKKFDGIQMKNLSYDEVPKSDKIEYNQIFNGRVYYFNSTSTQNCRLYASDGTSAGTVLIKDLGAIYSTGNGNHSTVGSYNQTTNLFYFLRSQFLNPATGGLPTELTTELWVTDGTTAGTIKLLTKTTPYISYSAVIPIVLFGDAFGTNPYNVNFVGNKLIFTAYDPDAANVTYNNQIAWVTDGTVAGTQPLLTANGEKIFGGALGGTKLNGKYFFGGRSQATLSNGGYLYETDGTQTGTIKINPTAVNWYVGSIFSKPLNGKFLFWATNNLGPTFDQQNYEIWQSDGTAAGTTLFMETAAGFDSKKPYYGNVLDFVNDGEKLYFNLKQDPANNQSTEIWVTDGTLSNTKKIRDASNYLVDEVHIANGHVFFEEFLQSPSQFRMVYSDGTDSGTYVVSNINNNHPSMVVYNNSLYFKEANGTAIWFGNTVADNIEMWRSDGTIANTGLFMDIYTGSVSASGYTLSNSSKPRNFFVLGDSMYFIADNSTGTKNLYKFFGNYTFNNSVNNKWDNSANWNAGALPGATDLVTVPAGFNVEIQANAYAGNAFINSPINVVAGGLNIGGALTLGEKITLNTNNLNLLGTKSFITNGSAANYIVTNNTGKVAISNLNTERATITLPIGTATNYNPITIENTGTSDTFSVNVQDGISNTSGGAVNATWNISEAVTGGSNVNVSFTWNQAQENGLFNRNTATVGHFYNATWNGEASSAVIGTNPYTISATNISSFSPFGVLNQSALGIEDNNFVANQIQVYPNPTTTQFYINAAEIIESVEIYDVNGRKLKSVLPKTMSTEIEVTDLKTGVYFVNISTLINKNQTFKLIKN